jgi:hypothetical protein
MGEMTIDQQRALALARARRRRAEAATPPTKAQQALANAKKDAAGRLADAKRTNNKSAVQTYQREVTRLNKLTPDQFYKAPGQAESFFGGLVEGVTTPIRLGLDLIGAGGDKGQRERGTFRLRESQQRFPMTTTAGKITGDVLGTALLPGAAAKVVGKLAGGTKTGAAIATALGSSGFKTGLLPTRAAVKEGLANAPKLIDRVVDIALRGTAGAATGAGMAVASGQTDQDIGISSVIGALMPTVGSATFRTTMDKVLLPAWERLSNQLGVQQAAAVFRASFNMTIQEALALARSATGDTPFAKVVAQTKPDEPTVQALFKTVSEGAGKNIYAPLARAETKAQQDILNSMAGGTSEREARNAMLQSRGELGQQYAADEAAAFQRANLGGQVIPKLQTQTAQATQQAAEQSELARRMAFGANRADTLLDKSNQFDDYAQALDNGIAGERITDVGKINVIRGKAGAMTERAETAAQQAIRLRGEAAAAQQQIASLEAQGIRALETRPLVDQIRTMAAAEGAGEVQRKALLDVAKQIESAGSIIRAGDLDAIRRGVDVTIGQLYKGLDVGSVKKAAAGVVSQIKPLIDTSIETAGGKGYAAAKTAFATGASDIERRRFADELAGMFEKDPAKFAATVGGQRGTTGTVEAAFPRAGNKNFDIQEMMGVPGGASGPSRMPALENIAGEVKLNQNMALQADQGADAAKNLLKTPPQEVDIFHRYSPVGALTTAGRASLTFAKILSDTGLSTKVQQTLAEGFRNGEAAEKLLLTIPAADRAQIARRMMDNGLLSAKAMAGISTFNAMNTPPDKVLVGVEQFDNNQNRNRNFNSMRR